MPAGFLVQRASRRGASLLPFCFHPQIFANVAAVPLTFVQVEEDFLGRERPQGQSNKRGTPVAFKLAGERVTPRLQ
jgi:hypothetical protein